MGRRIGKPQTPTKAGYSDVFDIRQHQKYVKDNILANPKDDALGSVRFDGTDYLTRTPSTAGNRKTFTISVWAKRSALESSNVIYGPRSGSEFTLFYFSNQTINLYTTTSGSEYQLTTTAKFRDINSWYHIVVSVDTTKATQIERGRIYINGVEQSLAVNNMPQDLNTKINGTLNGDIGRQATGINYYKGYLSNFYIVEGLALDATYFGYTDRETGQWKPKRYTGDFGMNGFHLPMSGDFRAGYVRAGIGDYDNTNLENNKADIYSVSAATFTNVWKAHEGKWGKSSWGNNHGKIELTADDAYNLKDVSATPWTIEGWTKFVEEDGRYPNFVDIGTGDYNAWAVWYNGNVDKFYISADTTGGSPWDIDTGISLDPYDGEWHHWAYTRNTSGQYKLHFDGEYKGIIATNTSDLVTNNNTVKIFSHYSDSTQTGSDYQNPFVYHDSMRMIKGQDLYGTSDIAGWSADIWNIASTKETYVGSGTDLTGTVSFLLPPNRYDAPYKEISGTNNNFRIEGHRSYDGVKDSPQNTFATLDILAGTSGVFTQGTLDYQATQDVAPSTLGASSGSFYFEVYIDTSNNNYIGILDISQGQNPLRGGSNWNQHGALAYKANGTEYILPIGGTSSVSTYGGTMSSGDIIGVAFDIDRDTVTFYKNGISQGNTTYGPSHLNHDGIFGGFVYGGTSSSSGAIFNVNFGQDHTFDGNKTTLATPYTDANGIGEFYYPPPDGAFALCTKNLESGLSNITTTKKYYNRDETGKVLNYIGHNDYTYGTINDDRFSDLSPYASSYGGKSFAYDGNNQGIRIANQTDVQTLGSDFTVELWFYQTTTPSTFGALYVQGSLNIYSPINIQTTSAGEIAFYFSTNGTGWAGSIEAGTVVNNVWNHVAVSRDVGSGTASVWLNGTRIGTTSAMGSTALMTPTQPLSSGVRPANDQDFFGYITDIRLVKGSYVYDPASTTITVPTAPLTAVTNTKLLLQPYSTETVNNTRPMYTRDETGLISFSYGSGVSFANISPYEDNSVKSFRFKDGSSSDIGLKPENYTPNFDTNDFTMEWWFKPNTITGSYVGMHWAGNSSSNADEPHVAFQSSRIHLYLNSSWVDTSYTPKLNEWQHLAIVRDYGTSLKMYINGVEQYSTTTNASISNNYDGYGESTTYTEQVRFGMHSSYGFYDGLLCDIRMTSGVAIYTSDFTPPAYKLRSDFYTTDGTDPASSGTRSAFSSGQVRLLAQPYSQPAQIHDVGSTYRTNRNYQTDETGKNLIYG